MSCLLQPFLVSGGGLEVSLSQSVGLGFSHRGSAEHMLLSLVRESPALFGRMVLLLCSGSLFNG